MEEIAASTLSGAKLYFYCSYLVKAQKNELFFHWKWNLWSNPEKYEMTLPTQSTFCSLLNNRRILISTGSKWDEEEKSWDILFESGVFNVKTEISVSMWGRDTNLVTKERMLFFPAGSHTHQCSAQRCCWMRVLHNTHPLTSGKVPNPPLTCYEAHSNTLWFDSIIHRGIKPIS